MSLALRPNEKVIMKTDFHWSTYIGAAVWMCLCMISFLGMIFDPNSRSSAPFTFLIGVLPVLFRWLSNYCKEYVVTNERLYLEDGIFAKSKKDIPLNKINDIVSLRWHCVKSVA